MQQQFGIEEIATDIPQLQNFRKTLFPSADRGPVAGFGNSHGKRTGSAHRHVTHEKRL
jgi:hypothetical protein